MDVLSLSSTHHSHSSPFSLSLLPKLSGPTTTTSSISYSLKHSPNSQDPSIPASFRRPKPLKSTPTKSIPQTPKNPLKNLIVPSKPPEFNSQNLTNKLWLTSKISPPPPPPPPPATLSSLSASPLPKGNETQNSESGNSENSAGIEFRQQDKIFVGNLPVWVKKNQVAELFRQFGPIKNVILIKGHDEVEKNAGFGFVIYGGPTAVNSAMKAVEFDGIEFHGRVLTVMLDDGKRQREKFEERARWVAGSDAVEYRSQWHEERDTSTKDFKRVLETEPENWQAVVRAFEKIKKPSRREFGLMVNYYARRGDMHRAREAFESMRARGIEPSSHVYTSWQRHGRGSILCQENEARGH